MARNSLLAIFVLAATNSCIVTGSPDFSSGETTKPILTVVSPDVTELLCVQESSPGVYPPQEFRVLAQSEDTDTDPLTAILLLDYGTPTNVGEDEPQPWVDDVNERGVPVGSLNDEPREVALTWPINQEPGSCHSLTMLVARNRFRNPPYFHCPVDDQFATVTWFAALAEDDSCDFSKCPIDGQADFVYCPDPDELQAMLEET